MLCITTTNLLGFDNEIDIQKSIMLVRAQRSGMVQTEVSTIRRSQVVILFLPLPPRDALGVAHFGYYFIVY